MRNGVLIILFTFLTISTIFAQNNLNDLLKGSVSDGSKLLEGYAGPAMRSLGSGLTQGWYNTAKPHKTLGVDLTITTSLMYMPTSDEFYKVDNATLQQINLASYDGKTYSPTESALVPTIFGPEKTPSYKLTNSNATVNGIPGNNLKNTFKIANALPVPMYHLGVGLPKNFDLKVRFTPSIAIQDFTFSLFGVGVMHDIGKYIPGVKALPVDISAFVGFTKMKAEQGLTGTVAGQNQKGVLEFNATTIQALVSKKISVLTFYGGVGYNMVTSNLAMKGTYDFDNDGKTDATDPVNLDFTASGVRATGGLRLKLAVFTFHGDYTVSKYNSLSVGFGINVR